MTNAKARPRKKGRKRALAVACILLVSGLFIVYIAVTQIWNFTRGSLIKTEALCSGELKKLYAAEGVLLRNEFLIVSPADGQLKMLVEEGERVRVGDAVAEVRTIGDGSGSPVSSELLITPVAGLVSSRIDGLEGVLKPDQVDILEVAGEKIKAAEAPVQDNSKCRKGQPVVKIIDNLTPLLICLKVPEGFPPDRIKKDGSITLVWENNEFAGRITAVRDRVSRPEVLISTLGYPAGLLYERKAGLSLVGGSVSGQLVPVKALVEKEGQAGIYIASKQQFNWVPVEVEGEVNDRAAISGEQVGPGTRYVVNPRWFFGK